MTDATRREQLLYLTSLAFEDGSTVFTGFHWPVVAARVARRLHAPDLRTVFEAGVVNEGLTDDLLTSTTEIGAFGGTASMFSESLDPLRTYLASGELDGAVVDAANVDRFGNVNSSVIGDYDDPAVRLPGPGGARDILALGTDVTLVCGSGDARRYQDRVSYVSSPGYLDGDGSREAAGFEPDTGPQDLLTPMGRFEFDDTGRARLVGRCDGVTVEEVRETTGWEIPDGDYPGLPTPDDEALAVVREEMANAAGRGYTSIEP